MNKDAILATVIGFVIGLCITGIILMGPRIAKFLPKISIKLPAVSFLQPKSKITPTPSPKTFSLTIDSPLTDSISSDSELLVSGKTGENAMVVVQGNIDDVVTTATKEGKFAGKVTLAEGENTIIVTSYLKTNRTAQTITVFYTPEEQ